MIVSTPQTTPIAMSTETSQLTPTTVPAYIKFVPSEKFDVYLEFEYPGYWGFRGQKREEGLIIISLEDPRFRNLPTTIESLHPLPNDYGRIDIWVWPLKSDQTLITLVDSYRRGHSSASWITLLDDYKITIQEYETIVLEYQINSLELYTSLMFERDVFFVVGDQIYQITFIVADKERNSEFEQGYDHFLKSLRMVP